MKLNKPKSAKPALLPFLKPLGPMMTRSEAAKVTYTVSGDKMCVQAPRALIEKMARRLDILGAKADPKSPYGPSCERTEGEPR